MSNERRANNFSKRLNDFVIALNGQVKISNGARKRSNGKLEFSQSFFQVLSMERLTIYENVKRII